MIHVLSIDDEPDLLDLTRMFLEKSGEFTVTTAVSAEEALRLLDAHPYDAIVSDYQMPGMNGISLLQHLRGTGNTTPFIIFTGRGREDVVIEAINSGADFYLQKSGNLTAQFAEFAKMLHQVVMRSRTERALCEAEAQCHEFFKNASDSIHILDHAGRIAYESPAVTKILGYEPGSLNGKDPLDYIHPEDQEKIRDILTLVYKKQNPETRFEFRVRKADGSYIWVESTAASLTGGKEGDGVVLATRPVTSRKKAELALQEVTREIHEREEKYRIVFEAKNDPLILADAETLQIMDLNQTAAALYGYPRDELLRMTLLELSAEPEKTKEVLDHKVPRVPLQFHRKKDGLVFPTDIALAWFPFQERSMIVLSIRDLTGVQQISDALRIANVKLNLLIGVTRHDVLNSLTLLIAYNGFLKDLELDDATRDLLDKQEKALLAIRSQIDFTRAYDNLGIKAPLWQHVGNTATRAFAQFINTISFTCETGELEIYADPMLEKVFYNLFDNAFRYGGTVTRIHLYGTMDGTDLLLSFEDNGIGIAESEKNRIFSRGIGKNTGLGLFLTREILAITRIGITETGEYRKGARFTIRVPRGAYRLTK